MCGAGSVTGPPYSVTVGPCRGEWGREGFAQARCRWGRRVAAVLSRVGPGGARVGATQGLDAGGGRHVAAVLSRVGPGGARVGATKGLDAGGGRHVAAVGSGGSPCQSAPGATRTHTARVLNPLPLPIGVRGPTGIPGAGAA